MKRKAGEMKKGDKKRTSPYTDHTESMDSKHQTDTRWQGQQVRRRGVERA
jgi:hypothetical protein